MDRQFNADCIELHNKLRALHDCPPLKLDIHLAEIAQAHAEKMGRSQSLSCVSPRHEFGENICMHTGAPGLSAKQVILQWYGEISDFKFGEEKQAKAENFSQIIWKATTRAGFGRSVSRSGCAMFVVGLYLEPGNQVGQYVENVPPPLDGRLLVPKW
ncbi:unnamed protein product [Calicophoron daubneyi]|uniref:SCP domain-containing protein n=1 Tax=Calicophoron daubneyi TaxID=300641 RepID=A0AAV2TH45_CALDB